MTQQERPAEYSLREVALAFGGHETLRKLLVYRNSFPGDIEQLIEQPYPDGFEVKHLGSLALLTHNITTYDDNTEDLIGQNQVIEKIRQLNTPVSPEKQQLQKRLLRSQRTLVAHHISRMKVTSIGSKRAKKSSDDPQIA